MELHSVLGRTGRIVFRLGLSGSYHPGEATLHAGLDAGMNYVLWYWWQKDMARVLREVFPARREQIILATGVNNLGNWAVRRGLEACLRTLKTDYIDIFQIFWVGTDGLKPQTLDLLRRYQEDGKIRHIAISTHNRCYAAELVRQGVLDVVMTRYNAAHRGAEEDLFPQLPASNPGVVSYTATCWKELLQRPQGWPKDGPQPAAGDCYRFVLSNPNVDVGLTAPASRRELEENLAAVARGPLDPDEMAFMHGFGDAVYQEGRRWLWAEP
jgi:aryl-alcohol dehydrogenase-like predicted oxidoreductase